MPVAHALIPRRIWRQQPPLYLAIECYLRELGKGEPEDWALARELIRRALACTNLPLEVVVSLL